MEGVGAGEGCKGSAHNAAQRDVSAAAMMTHRERRGVWLCVGMV